MDVPSREQPTSDSQDEKTEFVPRGILAFLVLMLIVYAGYWAYLWFVVTIERGIGG